MQAASSPAGARQIAPAEFELSAVAVVSSEVALTWRDPHPLATTYALLRRRQDGIWSVMATLPATRTSFVDDQVHPGERYEYQVCRFVAEPRPFKSRRCASNVASVDTSSLMA